MEKYPKSLVDIATREIRTRILQGELSLGQRVTETELAAHFGMSKTPVREALQQLQREGLVQVRPRHGTFIFTLTDEEVSNLRGVRFVLEMYAIEEAMRKNRGRLLLSLGESIKKMLKIRDESKILPYLFLDKEFHALFFTHADNSFLDAAYKTIDIKLQVLWRKILMDWYTLEEMSSSIDEHRQLAELLLENQLQAAQTLLRRHIQRTQVRL